MILYYLQLGTRAEFGSGNSKPETEPTKKPPQYCVKPRDNKNFFDILIHLNIFVDPYCLSSLSYPKKDWILPVRKFFLDKNIITDAFCGVFSHIKIKKISCTKVCTKKPPTLVFETRLFSVFFGRLVSNVKLQYCSVHIQYTLYSNNKRELTQKINMAKQQNEVFIFLYIPM